MSDVSGWSFTIKEVSAGVYHAEGRGLSRMTVEHTCPDQEEALKRVEVYAAEMSGRLQHLRE
jgi:hypothetical protein